MKSGLINLAYKKVVDHTVTEYPYKWIVPTIITNISNEMYLRGCLQWKQFAQDYSFIEKQTKEAAELPNAFFPNGTPFPILDEYIPKFKIGNMKVDILDVQRNETNDEITGKIAIIFISETVTLIDVVGNDFLIALGDQTDKLRSNHAIENLNTVPGNKFSISSYQHIVI